MRIKKILLPVMAFACISCGNDPLPKPKAMLRLDYQKPEYAKVDLPIPFTFEKNKAADNISKLKLDGINNSYGIDINYPDMKGTIYLTYKKVTADNLNNLLRDAQNLTQKHTMKADEIESIIYENPKQDVYGMFYEVGGNAASQSQFYVTDSTHHFLSGSLYFYTKPNYDSIYPAAVYLKNDIKHLMESIEWKK
ncbi:gliding motility-associated lipoprotein GldD [Formosa sp. Hel1_31_208]|uniref:gliding motility lipoprotein GldD n=1 Tax=Formosa sp. Hel1_31_208 TaxID=1798225 RepID=UPI00087B5EEF|nr:gliding motility lipoprotein GldD [Formosa sp. Hel1_31_208]SDR81361.1 gliding motility-associated lipoprotein GldD [Formosa sp. Hel1_31_208]